MRFVFAFLLAALAAIPAFAAASVVVRYPYPNDTRFSISSGYDASRNAAPADRRWAVGFSNPKPAKVVAVADGTVTEIVPIGDPKLGAVRLAVQHPQGPLDGMLTYYIGLPQKLLAVTEGRTVRAGQELGTSSGAIWFAVVMKLPDDVLASMPVAFTNGDTRHAPMAPVTGYTGVASYVGGDLPGMPSADAAPMAAATADTAIPAVPLPGAVPGGPSATRPIKPPLEKIDISELRAAMNPPPVEKVDGGGIGSLAKFLLPTLLIAFALFVIFIVVTNRRRNSPNAGPRLEAVDPLTPTELHFLNLITEAVPQLRVHPKMALDALLEPVSPRDGGARNMLRDERAGYVVMNHDGVVLAVVEVDDFTHDNTRTRSADMQRDARLQDAGYVVFRWRCEEKARPSLDQIRVKLSDPRLIEAALARRSHRPVNLPAFETPAPPEAAPPAAEPATDPA